MNYITQLEQLLKTDVLLEVEANIKEIQAELLKKKSKALKEELEYMQNVKLYFDEVLIDIQKKPTDTRRRTGYFRRVGRYESRKSGNLIAHNIYINPTQHSSFNWAIIVFSIA